MKSIDLLFYSSNSVTHRSLSLFCCILLCLGISTNAQQSSPEDLYGKGSTKKTSAYEDLNGYTGTQTVIYDAKGTPREERIEATKTSEDRLGGTDMFKMEIFIKKDCNGNRTFFRTSTTKNGQEIKYEDAVYEPPKKTTDMIKQIGGIKRTTDEFGNTRTERFDPKTRYWVEIANVQVGSENYASIEPSITICPPDRRQCIFIGPSFHRESYDGDGVNLFGGIIGYAHQLNENLEAVAHGSVHFKKEGDIKTQKTFLYAGINVFPFDEASPDDKVAAYAYGRAGMAFYSDKFDAGGNTYKNSESSFAWIGGAGVRIAASDRVALFIQGDYGTSKLFGRKQNNIRASAGLVFCF